MGDHRGLTVYEEPASVSAVEGEVVVLGPGAISGAFTPEAAVETARRLLNAADRARRQARQDPARS